VHKEKRCEGANCDGFPIWPSADTYIILHRCACKWFCGLVLICLDAWLRLPTDATWVPDIAVSPMTISLPVRCSYIYYIYIINNIYIYITYYIYNIYIISILSISILYIYIIYIYILTKPMLVQCPVAWVTAGQWTAALARDRPLRELGGGMKVLCSPTQPHHHGAGGVEGLVHTHTY
jgi:hypothetical protein